MGAMVCVVFVPLVAIINGSVKQSVFENLVGVNTAVNGTALSANRSGIELHPRMSVVCSRSHLAKSGQAMVLHLRRRQVDPS